MHCVVMKSPGYFILTYVTSIGNQLSNAYKNIYENFNLSAVREQKGLATHFERDRGIVQTFCGLFLKDEFLCKF